MEEDEPITYNDEEEEQDNSNYQSKKMHESKLQQSQKEGDMSNLKSEMDEENVRDIFDMEFDSIEDWMSTELGQLSQKFKTQVITMNIQTPAGAYEKSSSNICND